MFTAGALSMMQFFWQKMLILNPWTLEICPDCFSVPKE